MKPNLQLIRANTNFAYPRICRDSMLKFLCQIVIHWLVNTCTSTNVCYSVQNIVIQILQLCRSMGFPAIKQR
jgi:hypothetical protein